MHLLLTTESGISSEMDTISIPEQWNKDIVQLDSGTCATKFRENTSIVVVGRSGSGKTTFIRNLLENAGSLFEGTRQIKVLYLYKSDQKLFHQMALTVPNIEFHKGMMSANEILDRQVDQERYHLVIVFDDLMRETAESPDVMDLFTINCHHYGCSVILLSHNIFHQGKYSKTLAVNAGYVVLFETPASMQQVQLFGRQRFPLEKNMLLNVYKAKVCDEPYGYIVIDMNSNVCRFLRIKGKIFPRYEYTEYYYDPKYT